MSGKIETAWVKTHPKDWREFDVYSSLSEFRMRDAMHSEDAEKGIIKRAQMLVETYDWKAWGNPVTWIVSLLVGLLSGVYFPPKVLPTFVQGIGACLPQTYAYDVARLAVLTGANLWHPTVYRDMTTIILQMIVLLPMGIILYRMSLRKAERDGALTRWS